MSQFDSHIQATYIRKLASFLGCRHAAVTALRYSKPEGHRGRLPRRPDHLVEQLEKAVNDNASRCEAMDTTFVERFSLALAYRTGLSHVQIALRVGVTREAVRQWAAGICYPRRIDELADVLAVPVAWLSSGGEHHLPADSPLGVRVGSDNLVAREKLYGLTLPLLADVQDSASGRETTALIEKAVFANAEMSIVARQAGGRWHVRDGELVFVPWVPLAPRGLARRDWSDEVETFIAEALAKCHSVYSAWHEVRRRCEATGLPHPGRIALHKRVAKARKRAERFGVDLNPLIATVNLKVN